MGVTSLTCRTCLKQITDGSIYYSLAAKDLGTELPLREKLEICVRGLDLAVTPNAVVCQYCYAAIESVYQFKMMCYRSEYQIQKYLQHLDSDTADLSQMLKANQINSEGVVDVQMQEFQHGQVIETTVEDDSSEKIVNSRLPRKRKMHTCLNRCADGKSGKKEAKKRFRRINAIAISFYRCHKCTFISKYRREFVAHVRQHCAKSDYHRTRRYANNSSYSCKKIRKINKTNNIATTYNNQDCETNISYSSVSAYFRAASEKRTRDSPTERGNASSNEYSTIEQNISSSNLKSLSKAPLTYKQCIKYRDTLRCHIRMYMNQDLVTYAIRETSRRLLNHIGVFEKPVKCSFCDFSTAYKLSLQNHEFLHTGKVPVAFITTGS